MKSISRDEILRKFPLTQHMERVGVKFHGSGRQLRTNRCPNHEHKKDHLCVDVDTDKQIFCCHDCNIGGSIVDWIAAERNCSTDSVYSELAREIGGEGNGGWNGHTAYHEEKRQRSSENARVIAEYDYFDEHGERLFRVERLDPKDFRQGHWVDGKWVKNMTGVRRVLYHLPEVLLAEEVWIVEGEKDADTLMRLGCTATCNVGGAGKWMDGYTESLQGKDVVLCGDNDDAGIKHVMLVRESLAGKVKSTRTVKIPSPHKDVTEFTETFEDDITARLALDELRAKAAPVSKGVDIHVSPLSEIEPIYIRHCLEIQQTSLNLSGWLPSLQSKVRSIVPGEIITFIADTGVGKTCLLSNLAIHAAPLTTLFFEMELPDALTFERFMAATLKMRCIEVEEAYRQAAGIPDFTLGSDVFEKLRHICVCPEAGLTVPEIDRLIVRSELKTGKKPNLVLIDYMQLIQGDNAKSRYEKTSIVAEQLKVVAKERNVIMVIASQIARKQHDSEPTITLHEGKDSGSIENSSGLVIGVWRDQDDSRTMYLQILKNTKGGSGYRVECNFDGERMLITEKAKVGLSDYPEPYAEPAQAEFPVDS